MAMILCPKCDKRMVTPHILELHLKKSHSENPMSPNPSTPLEPVNLDPINVSSRVEAPMPIVPVVPEVPKEVPQVLEEQTPVVEPKPEMVIIRSADNRRLEVSVGNQIWNNVNIEVPKELAGEVRRILLEGGFFLKD